ncbi:serine protease [Chlorella sorokiniana]|uniref:Serine protease n=1 Tax=Chlorella sorokiniana TaxID=3076 RepID=A0A2P6TZ90_CHLSO|nr:serine protease [Chlorella sorokiniana]|eukprot:PRW59381.1 serine protease [Chlorella sorokiniana]
MESVGKSGQQQQAAAAAVDPSSEEQDGGAAPDLEQQIMLQKLPAHPAPPFAPLLPRFWTRYMSQDDEQPRPHPYEEQYGSLGHLKARAYQLKEAAGTARTSRLSGGSVSA